MRVALTSLTSQQQRTLAYSIGFLLAIALAAGILFDLGRKRAEAASVQTEVERKEREAAVELPSAEQQSEWVGYEQQIQSVLLTDPNVPQVFEEVTRIANENGLQRLGINSEEKIINAQSPDAGDERLLALGIQRYLVVTLRFQADYPNVARFLSGVLQLPRAVEYQSINMRRQPPLVDVTVVMNIYKKEGA
jgi:Tfp pilus assembly protein PilO